MDSCYAPKNIFKCYACRLTNANCKRLEELREAIKLKSFDDCLDVDSNCFKCSCQEACSLLKDKLEHKGVRIKNESLPRSKVTIRMHIL
jgi:hypothetical protein